MAGQSLQRLLAPFASRGRRHRDRRLADAAGRTIVADIVGLHGWSITATNADAGGARFEITDIEFVDDPDGPSVDRGSP